MATVLSNSSSRIRSRSDYHKDSNVSNIDSIVTHKDSIISRSKFNQDQGSQDTKSHVDIDTNRKSRSRTDLSGKRSSGHYENVPMDQHVDTVRTNRIDDPAVVDDRISSGRHRSRQRNDPHCYDRRVTDYNDHQESVSSQIVSEKVSKCNGHYNKYTDQQRHSQEKIKEYPLEQSSETERYSKPRDREFTDGESNLQIVSSRVRHGDREYSQGTNNRQRSNLQVQSNDTYLSSGGYKVSQQTHRGEPNDERVNKMNAKERKNSHENTKQRSSISDHELRRGAHREYGSDHSGQEDVQRHKHQDGRSRDCKRDHYRDISCDHLPTRRRSSSVTRNEESRYNRHTRASHNMSDTNDDSRYNLHSETLHMSQRNVERRYDQTAHSISHSKVRSLSKQNLTAEDESKHGVKDTSHRNVNYTSKQRHDDKQRHSSAQQESKSRSIELAHTEAAQKSIKQSPTFDSDSSKCSSGKYNKEAHRFHSKSPPDETQTLKSCEMIVGRRDKISHTNDNDRRSNRSISDHVNHSNMSSYSRRRSVPSNNELDELNVTYCKQDSNVTRRHSKSNLDTHFTSLSSMPGGDENQSRSFVESSTSLYANEKCLMSHGKDIKHSRSEVMVNRKPADISLSMKSKRQALSLSETDSSNIIGNCNLQESHKNVSTIRVNKQNVEELNKDETYCMHDDTRTPTGHEIKNEVKETHVNGAQLSNTTAKENLMISKSSTNSPSVNIEKEKESPKTLSRGNIVEWTSSLLKSDNITSKSSISDSISSFFGRSSKESQIRSNQNVETSESVSFSERLRRIKEAIIPETGPSASETVPGKDTTSDILHSAASKIINSFNSFTGMQITLSKSMSSAATQPAEKETTSSSLSQFPPNDNTTALVTSQDTTAATVQENIATVKYEQSIESHSEKRASKHSLTDKATSSYTNTSNVVVPPDTPSQRPSTISTNGNLSTHQKRINVYSKMTGNIDSPDSEKSGQMTPPKSVTEMKRRSKEGENELTSFLPAEMSRREEKFHEAARVNDAVTIRNVLKERVNINCRNSLDRTALHWAAANGNLEATEALIESGADLEAKDKYGMRAMLWAAWFGHISVLKALVNAGASTRVTNKQGLGMLHCASENNHMSVIAFVFEALEPHDVNERDKNDRTPLHLAAEGGHVEAANRLLEAKADLHKKDKGGMTAVHLAAKHGHIEVLKALLLQGVEVDDRDVDGKTALHLAAEAGHKESVDLLLDYTANPNSETVKEVTPLHIAAQEGHVEVCRSLVKYGSNVNAQNFQGNSALHIAANGDHKEVARILIDVKCELDLPNNIICNVHDLHLSNQQRLQTPLHVAIESGHLEVVQVLLAGGANLDIREKSGKSALQLAARGNYVAVVDMLIKAERYYANAREYHDKDVGYVDPDTYLRNPQHSKASQMKDIIWKLANKLLKPTDWKKLAYHWHFTPEHVKAIEQEYTGTTSYKEHGYRLLDIWLHGVRKDENALKLLTEALIAIDRKQLAESEVTIVSQESQ